MSRDSANLRQLYLPGLLFTYGLVVLIWVQWARQFRPGLTSYLAHVPYGLLAVFLSLLAIVGYRAIPPRIKGLLEESWFQDRWAKRLLALAILLYIAIFIDLTFQRHYHFNSAGYDLAIMDQVIWNTADGRWYQTSLESANYLGDHFQPLLALLAPLYLVWPSPYVLLAFQTIVLALGAIPAFRLAQRRLGTPFAGLVFAVVYLIYPSVGFINRFDLHWEMTVIPLLLAAVDMADDERCGAMSLFLFFALLGKEEIGLTVAAFGLWLAWRKRTLVGAAWAIAGVAYSLVVLFLIIPAIRMTPSDTLDRYVWIGDSAGQMLATLFTEPVAVARHLANSQTLIFFFTLLGPVLFLPLLSSQSLVLLPAIAYNLLSNFPPQHTVYYQYMAPLVPFVVASAIYGTERLLALLRSRSALPVTYAVLVTLFTFALWHVSAVSNPLVDNGLVTSARDRLPNEAAVRRGLEAVPPDSSVFTTNHYAPHLSHRPELYVWMLPEHFNRMWEADVLFMNLRVPWEAGGEPGCDRNRAFLEIAAHEGFALSFHDDGVVVLSRDAEDALEMERLLESTCG